MRSTASNLVRSSPVSGLPPLAPLTILLRKLIRTTRERGIGEDSRRRITKKYFSFDAEFSAKGPRDEGKVYVEKRE